MSNNKKLLVAMVVFILLGSALLVMYFGVASNDLRLGQVIGIALDAVLILGILAVLYVQFSRIESIKNNTKNIEFLGEDLVRRLESPVIALSEKLDHLEQASQARFQRLDKRLGRQGRRIESTYLGVAHNLGSVDSAPGTVPLATRMDRVTDSFAGTNVKLNKLQADIDQSSKRLREQSAQLRLILEEHSKLSSPRVLAAKAAVIEEILEGIDTLNSQGARREPL